MKCFKGVFLGNKFRCEDGTEIKAVPYKYLDVPQGVEIYANLILYKYFAIIQDFIVS